MTVTLLSVSRVSMADFSGRQSALIGRSSWQDYAPQESAVGAACPLDTQSALRHRLLINITLNHCKRVITVWAQVFFTIGVWIRKRRFWLGGHTVMRRSWLGGIPVIFQYPWTPKITTKLFFCTWSHTAVSSSTGQYRFKFTVILRIYFNVGTIVNSTRGLTGKKRQWART